MAAFLAISEYSSDSEESNTNANQETNTFTQSALQQKGFTISDIKRKMGVNAAPAVDFQCSEVKKTVVDPKSKEVSYNPKYDELFSLEDGSVKTLTNLQKPTKNMLTGYVEPAHVNDFHFDSQQKTFHSYGYALDPSVEVGSPDMYIGNIQQLKGNKGATVFEVTKKRQGDKRKKQRASDPSDVEGYLGPWAKYKDEKTVMKPTEEEQIELDEITAKRQKKGKKSEEKPMEEKSTLHTKDAIDYQGRSFLHIPQDVGVNLRSEAPPEKCYIPKKNIHVWTGHTKALSAIRWFPKSGHLLLSCGMDAKIKIWEVYNERRCIRTYLGHKQAVKDVNFNNNGTKFLSAGYDRYIKLWDTETGKCISKYTSRKVPYCVKFNPDEDKQHLFVAGTSDKKIVCWDTNTGEIVQEYDRHLGAVNSITFVDDNRRFVSTSDDKSLRVWEWDIPVDMKYIADPSMHSMPAVTLSPNSKWLACQSMDNKVMIFSARERFKWNRKKVFKGHIVAGYACSVDFSPEMSYLASGDADGKVFVWDWKTTKLFSKFVAHENVCISVLWHPHETSKLVTAGWDGLIKYWD